LLLRVQGEAQPERRRFPDAGKLRQFFRHYTRPHATERPIIMSAARTRAPNVDTIASDLAKEHPDWNRERLYNEAHGKYVVAMRAHTNEIVKRVSADPAFVSVVRVQRAEQEARRTMRPQPNMTVLLNRERDRLMRDEACSLEEAVTRASETVRETMRLWERDHLQETNVILQRDAATPVQLAAPRAPAAKAPAPLPVYFNPGMSPTELKDAAARGQLPVRMSAPANEQHMRLMDRVKVVQLRGGDLADYTAAYLVASKEIADEDAAAKEGAT
jgi:hypothetical protein